MQCPLVRDEFVIRRRFVHFLLELLDRLLGDELVISTMANQNLSFDFYSEDHRRRIRSIYYAMIAEFDSMVGEYVQTIKDAGVWEQTVLIVTSDHGDMQMEKQQFCKL